VQRRDPALLRAIGGAHALTTTALRFGTGTYLAKQSSGERSVSPAATSGEHAYTPWA
jgi:hypothetical protein